MQIKRFALAVTVAAVLTLFGGYAAEVAAIPAGYAEYYYYPEAQVYYYPSVREYFWLDGEAWRHGPNAPARFVLKDRDRVRFELDRPPHTIHSNIKEVYKPHKEVLRERERG